MSAVTLPNFFILGTSKAGTTSLSAYLQQHPQIFLSSPKEPHFFTIEQQNIDFLHPGDAARWVTTWSDYLDLYSACSGEIAIGEASTSYLSSSMAAHGIHKRFPQARLIAVLRQPVERAYSAFTMYRRESREDKESLLEAIETERLGHGKHYHGEEGVYLARGFYFKHLSTYLHIFGKDQLKIFLYEDFKANPQATLDEIHEFLKVESFQPDMAIAHNIGGIHRTAVLQRLFTQPNPARFMARKLLPGNFRASMRERIKRADLKPAPPVDQTTWEVLLEEYREDIVNLQALIGRDLSHWLRPQP